MRVTEAENKGKDAEIRSDQLQHHKKSIYQGTLDDGNRQLEIPMLPVEELFEKQKELKATCRIKTRTQYHSDQAYDELMRTVEAEGGENIPPLQRKQTEGQHCLETTNLVASLVIRVGEAGILKATLNERQLQLTKAVMAAGTSLALLHQIRTPPMTGFITMQRASGDDIQSSNIDRKTSSESR